MQELRKAGALRAPRNGPAEREADRPAAEIAAPEAGAGAGRWAAARAKARRWAGGVVGALVVAAAGSGLLLWVTLPEVDGLRRAWPERTAYMELRRREAEEAGERLQIRYEPVALSSIPESVRRAVLVAEDAAFYQHGGFDWFELREAVHRAWERSEAPRGASTITQQLARNLYLSPERSWLRKLRESLITRRLERRLGKRRVLELYLNVIELGRGVFGVEAASRLYFGIPVSEVTPRQAAMLAATIPAPLRHNPATDTRGFRWRVRLVFGRAFGDRPEGAPAPEIPVAPPDVASDPNGVGPSWEKPSEKESGVPPPEGEPDPRLPDGSASRQDPAPP